MRLHYSQSSHENATPSSGTFPLASYKEVQPPPPPPRGPSPDETTSRFFFHSSPNIRFLLSLCYQSGLGVCSVGSIARLKLFWISRLLPFLKNQDCQILIPIPSYLQPPRGYATSIFSLLCFIFSLNWIKQLLKETENGTAHYI